MQRLREFIRFGMVGTIATGIHYGIYYGLLLVTPALEEGWGALWPNIAYTIGYILSFICNFYLTSYFTFKTKPSWGKLGGMIGAHAVNYGLHIAFLNLFLWLGIPDKIAPIPVFCIVIPINFLLVRFVFKYKKRDIA